MHAARIRAWTVLEATRHRWAALQADAMLWLAQSEHRKRKACCVCILSSTHRMQPSFLLSLSWVLLCKMAFFPLKRSAHGSTILGVLRIHSPDKFEAERDSIEREWPAYAADQTLCRLPRDLQQTHTATGQEWIAAYQSRTQHCLSRMNHHIHPLVNAATGQRRSLTSCRPKQPVGKRKSVHT